MAGPAAAQEAGGADGLAIGVAVQLMPLGKLHGTQGGGDFIKGINNETEMTIAVRPFVEWRLHRYFAVAVAPRYILDVDAKKEQNEEGSELDVLVRLTGILPLTDRLSLFVQVSPGYSVIFRDVENVEDPKGPVLDLGAGFQVDVTSRVYFLATGGDEKGFQRTSVPLTVFAGPPPSTRFSTWYLYGELGLGVRL